MARNYDARKKFTLLLQEHEDLVGKKVNRGITAVEQDRIITIESEVDAFDYESLR